MHFNNRLLLAMTVLLGLTSALMPGPRNHRPRRKRAQFFPPRQLPAEPVGVQQLTTPSGATISYKEPGKEGICETTPGVGSYSGYVNLGPDVHSFVCLYPSRAKF